MKFKIALLSCLFIIPLFFITCSTKETVVEPSDAISATKTKSTKPASQPSHEYGGWYCPDNIMGFPAVDVKEIANIPVIADRMPTREETMASKSLIYIDPAQYPDAKPLPIKLPQLARYYSEFTRKNELVVLIQAVEIGEDSIVGFRYLNGGNGSARISEVKMVPAEEQQKLGATPFVTEAVRIKAQPEFIWEIITDSTYAKTLGAIFDKGAYLESTWEKDAEVHFKYEPDRTASTGIITVIWKNTYIQIDYDFDGYHYVEKILLSKNKEQNHTELRLSAGPYGADFVAQQLVWHNWLYKVKELSERKMGLEHYFGVGMSR